MLVIFFDLMSNYNYAEITIEIVPSHSEWIADRVSNLNRQLMKFWFGLECIPPQNRLSRVDQPKKKCFLHDVLIVSIVYFLLHNISLYMLFMY